MSICARTDSGCDPAPPATLSRSQALMGAIALSMFERPRGTLQPWYLANDASRPNNPTPKRAKVKAARKAARKKK